MSGNGGNFPVFKRVLFSLVREGTRLKVVMEGYEQYGCALGINDYVRGVLDGKGDAWGIWLHPRKDGVK